jgi:TolB protein
MRARVLGILSLILPLLALPAAASATTADGPGDGWYLAVVDHGPRGEFGVEPKRQRLVLIAPDGAQRTVLTRTGGFQLVDWSPDGATALLLAGRDGHHRAIAVDVATGDTASTRLPYDTATVALAPDGGGVLTAAFGDGMGEPLSHVDWDGTRTRFEPRMNSALLPSPDGTTLLTNGPRWDARVMRVLSAVDGSVVRRVPVPGRCQPVRWWDDERALLTCDEDLALLDPVTGAFERLTRSHDRRIGDLGHLDARLIDSGLYVQVAGPCGYVFLGKHRADGRVTKVEVPRAVGNVNLVGATEDRLVIEHAQGCDGGAPRAVLGQFDPVTGHEQVLVRLPRSEDFGRILAFGERQPLGY